ncbi:RTA1 like protein-domain-containing protein [Irpex lacteus]|nr:RTA1 like protein-domain-containing protein [Irpex lacteus]
MAGIKKYCARVSNVCTLRVATYQSALICKAYKKKATRTMNSTASNDDAKSSPYNYIPSEGVALTFIILFGVSTGTNMFILPKLYGSRCGGSFQLQYLQDWEVIGGLDGSGQVRMSWTWTRFSCRSLPHHLTTPLLAANFIIFSRLVGILGVQYSRLSPRWYSRIFLSCDIVALIVQAAGGAIASSANTASDQDLGANVMLAGIVFQMAALVIFTALFTEYFVRFAFGRPIHGKVDSTRGSTVTLVKRRMWNLRQKLATGSLIFSTIVLFIRGVYRTIELADGWDGEIISTQVYFNVLDGAMIVLAIYTLNFFHPGVLLADTDPKYEDDKPVDGAQSFLMSDGPNRASGEPLPM